MSPISSSATSSSSTSSSSIASSSSSSPAIATSVIPSTHDPDTVHKKNLDIALACLAGVLGLLLIMSIVYFCYILRRRRPGNSVISNNRNGRGYSQSGDIYPLVQPYPHSIEQTAHGKWRNFQYGFVGNMTPPEMSPPRPAQQVYHTPPQNHYDHGPSRYAPGYISSSPPMVGPRSPLLNSSATGVDMLRSLNAEDLP